MALPVVPSVIYTCVEPSTQKKIQFKPYTVADEKSLLLAQQSDDAKVMFDTLKTVIQTCTFGSVDVDSLPMFAVEYLFLQIHGKSSGEETTLRLSCQADGCDGFVRRTIDITAIPVVVSPQHQTTIKLTDTIGIVMKYPSASLLSQQIDNQDANNDDLIIGCIDYVYNGEEITMAKDVTNEELKAFILGLDNEKFSKITEFFETMPKVEKTIDYECPKCKHQNTITLSGLQDFF